ncbi:MAG: hypothetical protein Q9228_000453 [Teloschistes exilis]
MRPSSSLVFCASSLATIASVSSTAIDKRHIQAWPEAIRSYYAAASSQLSNLRSTIPTATLAALTPSSCNLASPVMPSISGLPAVSEGLSLYHVAVGRGTQNYTCDTKDPESTPVAAGASAILYNATCMSCIAPMVLAKLPASTLLLPTPKDGKVLFPAQAIMSGHHYFTDSTPTFNLHTAAHNFGIQFAKVLNKVPVPETQQQLGTDGSKAVVWLKLSAADAPEGLAGDASPVKEIYRVNTAGGSPPKTCEEMPGDFTVQYAAEYWFWG